MRRWAEIGFNSWRLAIELGVSLVIGMIAREYARAWAGTRLHDPTPRLWGRLTLSPRSWFDPFGSGLLPGLILVLWGAVAHFYPPPVAYGKPAPVDPSYFHKRTRDQIVVGLAGPGANVVLGAMAGLAFRVAGAGPNSSLALAILAFEFTQFSLAIFHLLPVPGLDGARLVALALPPEPATVYRNADKYLPLFVLVLVFLLAGVLRVLVYGLVDALCEAFSGVPCYQILAPG